MHAFRERLVLALIVGLLPIEHAGCSPSGPTIKAEFSKAITGPHGGQAFPLPDQKKGYVEVLVERVGPTKTAKPSFVVYYLGPDGKAPMAERPSAVTATFNVPEGIAPTTLTPKAAPKDASAVRFASEPGDFDADEYQGTLKSTLGGTETEVSFAIR